MFEGIRSRILRILRVPHDPTPPAGAPGSVKVFRAGRNFYKLRLLRWGLAQVGALVGIVISLTVLDNLERGVDTARVEIRQKAAAKEAARKALANSTPDSMTKANAAPAETRPAKSAPTKAKASATWSENVVRKTGLLRFADRWPMWVFPVLKFLEFAGILLYFLQIPLTYALARLDYELRWYIVTDRSLRIRAGLTSVQESTMSFANVQQVAVSQGPLQRLLGLADLRVQSAGGGGDSDHHGQHASESLHTGVFHGVDNASELRDLILERLRLFRQAGLGDPEELHRVSPAAVPPRASALSDTEALDVARELLQEAKAWRSSLR